MRMRQISDEDRRKDRKKKEVQEKRRKSIFLKWQLNFSSIFQLATSLIYDEVIMMSEELTFTYPSIFLLILEAKLR